MKAYYEATEEPEPEVPSTSTAVGNQSPEPEMPILNSETSAESVEDMDDTNAVGGKSFLEALKEYALEVQIGFMDRGTGMAAGLNARRQLEGLAMIHVAPHCLHLKRRNQPSMRGLLERPTEWHNIR
nr:unnamed protein product [Spirometra erinaceieuropaei]